MAVKRVRVDDGGGGGGGGGGGSTNTSRNTGNLVDPQAAAVISDGGQQQMAGQVGPAPIPETDYEFQYPGGNTGAQMPGVGMGTGPNTGMPGGYGVQGGYGMNPMQGGGSYGGSLQDYANQFGGGLAGNIPPREGMPDLPGATANTLQTMDFANHPALQSAMEAFKQTTLPTIANAMSASGLGRSGAAGAAISQGQAQMALPVMQQLMDLEMQGMGLGVEQRGQDINSIQNQLGLGLQARGQDLGARGQDIGALLQGRGQDIGALLQGRGQDLEQMLTGRAQDLTGRGQNLDALLQQSQQALGARGQDIGAMQAGMGGMLQGDQQAQQRYMDALNMMSGLGGTQRSIEDARLGAEYGEQERQYGLARDLLFGPLGQLTQQVGSRTTQSGGK